jgi:hypothetical protein
LYDADGRYAGHNGEPNGTVLYNTAASFQEVIYLIVEADSAYCRRNFPWAAYILSHGIKECGLLLRSLYDKQYPFLALKKINKMIPVEEYRLLKEASENLNEQGFPIAVRKMADILAVYIRHLGEEASPEQEKQLDWLKHRLDDTLFLP